MSGKMTGFDRGFTNSQIINNVIWSPHYKQALALKSPAFELLFGGAAGGGKSDFLLMDYYAGVNEYGGHWKGVLFRRTYAELEQLKARAIELYYPLGGRLANNSKDFIFPTGAVLKTRYLDNDKDVINYQGHEYTWVGFDELGNYPSDFAWRYMVTRARSSKGVPCYIRGTANPGGAGHAWIRARFIDGIEPFKIHRTVEISGTAKFPVTRCFIPSRIEDNPTLMKNDPDYQHRLKLLPGHLYRALRLGDWDIFAGQMFDTFRRSRHVVKPFALEPGKWKKFYALDWGYQSPFSLGKWAVSPEGRLVRYGEWYGCSKDEMNTGIKLDAAKAAARAREAAVLEGVTEVVADTSMWRKDDDGPCDAEKWEKAGFEMIQANKDRVNGMSTFNYMLSTDCEDGKPMLLVFDTCVDFIRIIPTLTPSPSNNEDVDTRLEDHIYDESRYAVMSKFAHRPQDALRKQNGNFNFRKKAGKGWDSLKWGSYGKR